MPRQPTPEHAPGAPAPAPEAIHDPHSPPEPEPAARAGREANGRFAKNNGGGPGNPFARQTAALRKQLLESVTPEDMQAICTTLIWRARAGSVPHIKLLFSYIIGKPGDAVNPDTLDLQEMEQYRQELGMEELACKVGRSLTPEAACVTVQAVRPVVVGRICDALADQLLEGVPPEYLQPDSDLEADPAGEPEPPSPNGEIGEGADGQDPIAGNEGPSPNGDNGGPAPSDDGSERSGVTGRATSAGPRPPQAPPWPSGRPEAPPREAGGSGRRSAPREQRPVQPGGPPPRP